MLGLKSAKFENILKKRRRLRATIARNKLLEKSSALSLSILIIPLLTKIQ